MAVSENGGLTKIYPNLLNYFQGLDPFKSDNVWIRWNIPILVLKCPNSTDPPPVFLFGIAAKILVCQCLLLFNRKFWYVSAESSNGFVMVCLKNKVPQDPLVYHQQFPIKIVKID
jgi:hypothetical protein